MTAFSLSRLHPPGWSVPPLIGLVFLAAVLALAPAAPVLQPDSASYLVQAPFRTAGYPLFLALVGTGGVIPVQSALAAAALIFLGRETLALTGRPLAAAALMILIALAAPLHVYHFAVMTESLFVSLLMVLLGLLMRLSGGFTPGPALLASAVAGAMIAVRPAGWFLLPLMILAALILKSPMAAWLRILALILPLLGIAIAERQYTSWRFGGDGHSLMMTQLAGKAGLIEAPPSGHDSAAAIVLERDFAPIRALIARAPAFSAEIFVGLNYETCIEYACSQTRGLDPSAPEARAAILDRLAANPAGILALTWRNYRALWTVWAASHPTAVPVINAFIAENRPLPFEDLVTVLTVPAAPISLARLVQPAVLALGGLTLALAVAGLVGAARRPPPPRPLALAMIAALATQGSLTLTALTGVGISRYMLTMWPATMTALVLGGVWATGQVVVRRRRHSG